MPALSGVIRFGIMGLMMAGTLYVAARALRRTRKPQREEIALYLEGLLSRGGNGDYLTIRRVPDRAGILLVRVGPTDDAKLRLHVIRPEDVDAIDEILSRSTLLEDPAAAERLLPGGVRGRLLGRCRSRESGEWADEIERAMRPLGLRFGSRMSVLSTVQRGEGEIWDPPDLDVPFG